MRWLLPIHISILFVQPHTPIGVSTIHEALIAQTRFQFLHTTFSRRFEQLPLQLTSPNLVVLPPNTAPNTHCAFDRSGGCVSRSNNYITQLQCNLVTQKAPLKRSTAFNGVLEQLAPLNRNRTTSHVVFREGHLSKTRFLLLARS